MRRFYRIFAVFGLIAFVMSSIMVVTAEEVGQYDGDTRPIRWAWTYINSNGDVRKCRVKLNADNLTTTVWTNVYNDSINHWNTLDQQFSYSQDKVYAYSTSFANSKCDLYTAPSNHFIYSNAQYVLADAVTNYKNANGEWFLDDDGEEGPFHSGTATYARIYFKAPTESLSLNRRMWVMRHEIGHVMGLGHVNPLKKRSLMHPLWGENSVNDSTYYVTSYDISILEKFYPNP